MRRNQQEYISGQTLLEIVVVLAIMVVILTGLVVAGVSALRFGQASRSRSVAVKYAQEGIELTRKLRDTERWDTFLDYGSTTTKLWCLDKNGVWAADDGDGVCPVNIDNEYARSVALTWEDPKMVVVVSVNWLEGGRQLRSELRSYLTQWR